MSKLIYPFTAVLKPMKPSKPNKSSAHVERLEQIMHSTEYGFEEKIDGISCIDIGGRLYSIAISKKTKLPSEKSIHASHISGPLRAISSKLVLHGELYYPYRKSNFVTTITNRKEATAIAYQLELAKTLPAETLPDYVNKNAGEPFTTGKLRFIVYDVLRDIDGEWIVHKPFRARRAYLEQFFADHIYGTDLEAYVDLNKIHYDNFQQRLDTIIAEGGEGAVLKDLNARYYPGKRPMWNQVKLKQELYDDVVIIGFAPATRRYEGDNLEDWEFWEEGEPVTKNHFLGLVGSLEIGKYNSKGQIVPVGKVTGLTDALRMDITRNKDTYVGRVIKIKAMEKSEHGLYRHANFYKFHEDKNAEECLITE